MLDYVKQHPYLSGAFIVGAIILFMLLRGGSSAASPGNAELSSLYGAQAAAETANKQINAQLAGQAAAIGGSIEMAKLASARDITLGEWAYNLELRKVDATQQITDLANTLTANVAFKQIQAGTDQKQIDANVSMNQYDNLAKILIEQSQSSASIARASIENQCHGFGCLF